MHDEDRIFLTPHLPRYPLDVRRGGRLPSSLGAAAPVVAMERCPPILATARWCARDDVIARSSCALTSVGISEAGLSAEASRS